MRSNTAKITRRRILGLAAGAAAVSSAPGGWLFALDEDGNAVVKAAEPDAPAWKPILLSDSQADILAALAETIIPRTDTPGARDARCHECIDLLLSEARGAEQRAFTRGLDWLDARSKDRFGVGVVSASEAQRTEILSEISDEHGELDGELARGQRIFRDLKRRVAHAYYTSREGWVEELGLPEHVTAKDFTGCEHDGEHDAGRG